jgi:hypothetical protein
MMGCGKLASDAGAPFAAARSNASHSTPTYVRSTSGRSARMSSTSACEIAQTTSDSPQHP